MKVHSAVVRKEDRRVIGDGEQEGHRHEPQVIQLSWVEWLVSGFEAGFGRFEEGNHSFAPFFSTKEGAE
jgi:hypothetical protein